MMSEEELASLMVPYSDNEVFAEDLSKVLVEKGTAVVTCILDADECLELEELRQLELSTQSPQPGVNAHCQSELAWKVRLHPKVQHTFACIFGTKELSVSADQRAMFDT